MTVSLDPQVLRVPQTVRGKHVEKTDGRVAPTSKLGFLAASSDFSSDSDSIWKALNPKGTPEPGDIDPACRAVGALVVRAIPGLGLAVMRLKYRQEEALDEKPNRSFPLAQILLFKGGEYWQDIPPGLFSWAWSELATRELISGAPDTLPPFEITLVPPQRHVYKHVTAGRNRANRAFRIAALAAMGAGASATSLPVNPDDTADDDEPHYGEWMLALDVLAVTARIVAKKSASGLVDMPVNVAIGLSSKRAHMGLCFSASVKTSLKAAHSESAEVNELETEIKEWTLAIEDDAPEMAILTASGRRIGVDPISFGWAEQSGKSHRN